MMTIRKRLISLLLTLVMIFSLVPSSVFAEAGEGSLGMPAAAEETQLPEPTVRPTPEPTVTPASQRKKWLRTSKQPAEKS